MKTVVYQSFRTENVPGWISACMASVRSWATYQGFDYRFWDDSFFDLVPPHLRPRASVHKCLLSDYARLVAARHLLASGYDRAIWVDADATVFDPQRFMIDLTSGYAFCREVWHDLTLLGRPLFKLTVNNSVSVFCRDEDIIDTYLEAAESILLSDQPLAAVSIGTEWLHTRRQKHNFPLLTHVGILGPEMMYRYLHDDGNFLRPYLRYQTSPVYAVNLCNSKLGSVYRFPGSTEPWVLDNATLCRLIAKLQDDKGESLNRHFDRAYSRAEREFSQPLSRLQDWIRRLQVYVAHRFSIHLGKSPACMP
ncbi:MAG: hypothetical protein QM790_11045 [Nibricoccus sp.]